MFDDIIKTRKIRDRKEFKKLLDEWENYDPRIIDVIKDFAEKIDQLEKLLDEKSVSIKAELEDES